MKAVLCTTRVTYALVSVIFMVCMDKLNCKAEIVISSSSSDFGSSCNGLQCPPNTNCLASSRTTNGNTTNDKRCTSYDGKIVRQETTIIANGQICIKNVTSLHNSVNVDYNCRELNKEEMNVLYRQRSTNFHEAIDDVLSQRQDAIDDAMERRRIYFEQWRERMNKEREKKQEYLEKAEEYRKKLMELKKDYYEREFANSDEAWDKYQEMMEERLEIESQAREKQMELQEEARMLRMERSKDWLERKAEMLEDQRERADKIRKDSMQRAYGVLDLMAKSRDLRRMRW